jgi:ligand-binding SRPBCC domain-containing protein
MKLYFETPIEKKPDVIIKNFNKDLFLALRPPGIKLSVEKFDGCKTGDEVHLKIKSFLMTQTWVSKITQDKLDSNEWSFVDEGVKLPWPLKSWKHIHSVKRVDQNNSLIVDDINFDCFYSWMNYPMKPLLWLSFAVRPSRYKKFFMDKE